MLSACDTGNGTIDVHEGLTSLRRAAEEAGAQSTCDLAVARPEPGHRGTDGALHSELAGGASPSRPRRPPSWRCARLGPARATGPASCWLAPTAEGLRRPPAYLVSPAYTCASRCTRSCGRCTRA
ncbi:MAG: hypothetical protein IPG93_16505 [Burkholderiales bacterium]|nr:hypothetical protein [Burkholderiales bacterium]